MESEKIFNSFLSNLEKRIKEQGMTIPQFATKLNISRSSLNKYIKNEMTMSAEKYLKIVELLSLKDNGEKKVFGKLEWVYISNQDALLNLNTQVMITTVHQTINSEDFYQVMYVSPNAEEEIILWTVSTEVDAVNCIIRMGELLGARTTKEIFKD